MTPEEREGRARKAGIASQTIDRYVRLIVRRRDELGPEHREVLRRLADGTTPDDSEVAVMRLLAG